MVRTKKLYLYFFPGIFQPFSILVIRRTSNYKTELYLQFLGTVYHLCMKARGFTVSSSKMVTTDLPGAG